MSGIFNNDDLLEIASNHKVFKEEDERKCLENFACDPLFHSVRDHSETNAINIRQKLKNSVKEGQTQIVIWRCNETTYYRAQDSSTDCRGDPWVLNPEQTVEEYIAGRDLDYEVPGTQGGTYKVGRTLRLTNCLLLLANYFGSNFSCSMTRRRIEIHKQYHVYEVEIWLRWHPNNRSGEVATAVNTAVAAYTVRNPAPEAEDVPCEYCGTLYTHSGCGPANDYCSTLCYRRDTGVCDY